MLRTMRLTLLTRRYSSAVGTRLRPLLAMIMPWSFSGENKMKLEIST